jgi:hypothetical protein
MINKQLTIAEILAQCNEYLDDKGVVGRIGLNEFNRHLQKEVNDFPYKYLQTKYILITTAEKIRYRLPEYAKAVIYAINEDEFDPLTIKGLDDFVTFKDSIELTGEPQLVALGEYTAIENDMVTLGDLITVTSSDASDSGIVEIIGYNGEDEASETITINPDGDQEGSQRFTMITSITQTESDNCAITFSNNAGDDLSALTLTAGSTSISVNTKITYIGSTLSLVSDDTNDKTKVYISGYLDTEEKSETVTLNGTSSVTSSNNYSKIEQLYKF